MTDCTGAVANAVMIFLGLIVAFGFGVAVGRPEEKCQGCDECKPRGGTGIN